MNNENTMNTTDIDLDCFRDSLDAARAQLNSAFIQREQEILVATIALLTKMNLIFIGTPGVAKTQLTEFLMRHVADGTAFKIQCGAFTTEDAMFGVPDLQGYKNGAYSRITTGRLADCDFANLDEVFKTSDGCMNTMLNALNERKYADKRIKLRTAFCATNWPEINQRTAAVAAFYDRLVLRCAVREVDGEDAEIAMLEAGDREDEDYIPDADATFTVEELDAAYIAIRNVKLDTSVRRTLVRLCARLRKEKVVITPRRKVKCQNVLRAHAWLNGRDAVTLDDFDILKNVMWDDESQIPIANGVIDNVDQEVVAACIAKIDGALRSHADLSRLHNDKMMDEAPAVLKAFESAGNAVAKLLKDSGATRRGRKQIAKATAELKTKYIELSGKVNAHFDLNAVNK
jgi:MoxR-like ATPase